MSRRALAATFVLLAVTGTHAEDCRKIESRDARLACWDKAANFDSGIQEMIALQLRDARNASFACGYIIDADRYKMRLVDADLTSKRINDSSEYSQDGVKRLGDDTDTSTGQGPDSEYCRKEWLEYGPAAELPDDVLFKCRSAAACR